MRFAEVILRLAVGLVSWMFLYAHFLWLAALRSIGCAADGSEMHAVLLGIAPLTLVAATLLRVTRPLGEVHQILRWLATPLFLLLPLALWSIWIVLQRVHVDSLAICGADGALVWQEYWSPVQFIVMTTVAVLLITNWRSGRSSAAD